MSLTVCPPALAARTMFVTCLSFLSRIILGELFLMIQGQLN
jgi:hypothetical protein